MKKWEGIAIWLVLNLFIVALMDLAMFSQTTGGLQHKPWHVKLWESEKWATGQWLFIIPAARLGNRFLTVAQIGLSSFVFDFLGQIATNIFWLKIPISVDDWTAMGLIMFAMYVSVYKIFG
jgi:uncharacterized protein (DUF486 family)